MFLRSLCYLCVMVAGLVAARAAELSTYRTHARETTQSARKLVFERIDAIEEMITCRQAFERERIDLKLVRNTAEDTLFYNSQGLEGHLRISQVIHKPASPDDTLRTLAHEIMADAFVLGYLDGRTYVRTNNVVLDQGYFQQGNLLDGTWHFTTVGEKQALLLHEILHIALNKDDDYLAGLKVCPLRRLAACPQVPPDSGGAQTSSKTLE
jgi:hypothetical protein